MRERRLSAACTRSALVAAPVLVAVTGTILLRDLRTAHAGAQRSAVGGEHSRRSTFSSERWTS